LVDIGQANTHLKETSSSRYTLHISFNDFQRWSDSWDFHREVAFYRLENMSMPGSTSRC